MSGDTRGTGTAGDHAIAFDLLGGSVRSHAEYLVHTADMNSATALERRNASPRASERMVREARIETKFVGEEIDHRTDLEGHEAPGRIDSRDRK